MLMRPIDTYELKIVGSERGIVPRGVAEPCEATGFSIAEIQTALLANVLGGQLLQVKCGSNTALSLAARRRRGRYESWETALSPSGVPQIDFAHAERATQALLDQLDLPLLLKQVPRDSKAFKLLQAQGKQFEILTSWERAGLNIDGTFEQWMMTNFDQKRRKEFKRLRARLGEQVELTTQRLGPNDDLSAFVDDFLRLEAASWKGEKGTALANDLPMTLTLRQSLAASRASGKLRFWRMMAGDQAIASLFAFVEKGRATLGKIAHDEAFSKFSPGVLIVLDATADFFADPAVQMADANAIPGHPMIDRIWRDRLPMANLMVAGSRVSPLRFKALLRAEKLQFQLRSQLKSMYYRIKGARAS
jgi:hypothetical protein